MSKLRHAWSLLVALATAAPGAARGQATTPGLSEGRAVELAVQQNPALHAALLEASRARYAQTAEEALYVPVFRAHAGYTRLREPGVRGDDVVVGTNEIVDLGAGIVKTFPTGTVVSLDLSGQRSLRTAVFDTTTGVETTSGPTYGVLGTLALTQPLLRGAGTDVGRSSLRQAEINRSIAELSAQSTASQTLQALLNAYWELWYSDETVRINQASRDLAKELEAQAKQQAQSGAIAPIDALPYATRVAELDEAVVAATTARRQRNLELLQALGDPGRDETGLSTSDQPTVAVEEMSARRALDDAFSASFELKQLDQQIALAKEQAKVAGEGDRARLDLDAYVQAQGLGNREVPPAFGQFGRMEAVSAHVGLTFETPVSSTRRDAERQSALLAIHVAEKQRQASEQRLKRDVLSAVAQVEAARSRLDLADATLKVARQQVEGERQRFASGSSIAAQVQQAEDSLRQAELRVQRAKVDLTEAQVALLHLRGKLLTRYASALAGVKPSGVLLGASSGY